MMATAEETKRLEIPAGWAPESTCITVVAIYDFQHQRWEAFTPAFSVAGQGDTVDEAVEQTLTLLRRYLALCARDGMTFEEARRRIDWRWALAAFRAATRAWLHDRRRRHAVHRFRRNVLPAH